MVIRQASTPDWPSLASLARECGLDYDGMESDEFWVAEDAGRIVGIVALKTHPDCRELCALGVDATRRRKGTGRRLVLEVLRAARGEVYLATIIPGFFLPFGFEKTARVPRSMVKDETWCAGCRRDLCEIMVRREP